VRPLDADFPEMRGISLFPLAPPGCVAAETRGVVVRASTVFCPELSRPAGPAQQPAQYLFSYSIRFSLRAVPSDAGGDAGASGGASGGAGGGGAEPAGCSTGAASPTGRPPMRSCQLKSRHWTISLPDGRTEEARLGPAAPTAAAAAPPRCSAAALAPFPTTQPPPTFLTIPGAPLTWALNPDALKSLNPQNIKKQVAGEGVVGRYPLLRPGAPEFVYQSCTHAPALAGGAMAGAFAFVPGSLEGPQGPEFDVACPRFALELPPYVF